MSKKDYKKYFFYFSTASLCLFFTAVLIWASNKGFDLSDGGIHLYLFSNPNRNFLFASNFHLVQNYFFSFVPITIHNLRIERIILSLISVLILTKSISYFIKVHFENTTISNYTIFLFTFFGVYLSYAFGPLDSSYNTFSSFFVTVSFSLFLFDLDTRKKKWKVVFYNFAIGILLGILFLIKFPNAILFACFIPFYYFLYALFTGGKFISSLFATFYRFIIIVAAGFLFQLLFWKGYNGFSNFSTDFFNLINQYETHNNAVLIATYKNSLKSIFESLINTKFLLIIGCLIILVLAELRNKTNLFYVSLLLQAIVIIRFKMYYGGEANKFEQTIIYFLWCLALFLLFFIKNKKNKELKTRILFAVFLFFIPLIAALGTLNAIQVQVIFYMPFWLLLIFVLSELSITIKGKNAFYFLIVTLAFTQSLNAVIWNPYRINGTLLTQTEELKIGKSEIILVDVNFKKSLNDIDSVLKMNGIKKEDYLFTYSEYIGSSYIFKHLQPSNDNCWFDSNEENINLKIIQRFKEKNNGDKIFFILDKAHPFSEKFKNELKPFGLDFDKDYRVSNPLIVKFENELDTLYIYSPISSQNK